MATQAKPNIYEECKDIRRRKPEWNEMNEELSKRIASEYRTLPCFEQTLFEHLYIKHDSVNRNELLKCRWRQYRDNICQRKFSPFQFPSNRDLHFYNGNVKFRPAESIHRQPSYRMRLKPGPGVDDIGQMPIPNESLMKRGIESDDPKVKKLRAKSSIKKNENKINPKEVKLNADMK